MGCNLCSLQKREEHYKLLYEISQVNGRDLSRASHEEAAEALRSAKDPIVVQVLRRTPRPRGQGSVQDVCTQTEITFEHIMALAKLHPVSPPVPDLCPFLLSDSCLSLHTTDQEYFQGSEYLSNTPADLERTHDFEYEEVELRRVSRQEKLGLTLCYRTDDEEDSAIYISEIEPNSIAARDGRIREGDRILQINGRDVQDRQEAVAVLSSEECRNIVLLVARPEMQCIMGVNRQIPISIVTLKDCWIGLEDNEFFTGSHHHIISQCTSEEPWLDDEHSEFLEELKMEMLEEQRREEEEETKRAEEPWLDDEHSEFLEELKMEMLEEQRREEEEETKRAAREEEEEETKRAAREEEEEARQTQDESITASCSYNHQKIIDPTAASEKSVLAQIQKKLSRCLRQSSASGQSGAEKDKRCRQLLELKCQIRNSSEYDLFYARSSTIECSLTEPSGVERELRMLNEELRSIQMECQNIMKAHQLGSRKLADISEHPEKSDKDSSSAYNTAESSRSTPLTMDRSLERRRVSLTNQKNLLALRRVPSGSPDHSNPSESEQTPPEGSHSRIPARCQRPVDDPVHARQHQSYVQLIQQQSAVEFTLSGPQVARPSEPKMEWKVKVRSDGTRYITKRPIRDRLLRERALKIKEERSGGMTTDDDAMSEMKMGRYWSKEERKQHLLRAKEQRRRREFMQRSRLESLRENPLSSGEGIIELSQRKMMKKRNKKILDSWMTIQELMTHGKKAPEGSTVHNAFLSVTTV
ncbi:PDZ domain-containing RING finger protein 4-like [Sinocyclocheilus anshuiensis]|uniref:PDZ domain-containing RING finger protein 4-like n=1 Tax=Sinocyclocheilus anshuiensis TaxID=1608454 RepID=UPI0007B81893|nr:PREDICTED: PDZ domain-containing RING finger protein 4-like [Sinocyclocheilus anshuiensis]